jgi:alanyl-tRNA synthetase
MNPHDIRASFLKYFEERDHRVVDSSPVLPQGDPTLLFTNAGMNQFKDVLLGNETRDYRRATSVQKCVRAGGKHNDLDEVGKDGRHLTFFEMLGNWSFGDYYKRDAIKWAWDYMLNVLGLEPSRLYVTTYKDDDESWDIWRDEVGIAPEHMLRLGDIDKDDEENFWSMGPTGPCGPCTEIHYDSHPEAGAFEFKPGYDDERVVEIWNLVFMEFNRDETGELTPLPMKSVDTGMGLDRVAMIKAGRDSVFETELFTPILQKTLDLLGEQVEDWEAFYEREDFPNFAVIADHVRTVTFAVCDGAKFSNEGRGYVLRRILRRAVRFGRELGFDGPFLHRVSAAVVEHYSDIYPELAAVGNEAAELMRLEEERFFRNIDRGIELFEQAAEAAVAEGREELEGDEVFQLHATFGFPPDLTEIMAEEKGLAIDWQGYERLWIDHQEASRGKDVYADAAGVGDWISVHEGPGSEFVGYDQLRSATEIVRYWKGTGSSDYQLILTKTPFYAESGGQVGDRGVIRSADGSVEFKVNNTQRTAAGILHIATLERGAVEDLKGEFIAEVDAERRARTIPNHTATHLLHAALRDIVSDSIFQSGSLVAPDRLRFDFSHGEPVGADQLRAIEDRVNRLIRESHPVTIHSDVSRDRAVDEMGAMAIFGEKYGDKVRVVEIPGESVELCGGTHVKNTSEIQLFRITSESGVAAGIRRIEALTGESAVQSYRADADKLREVARTLKTDTNDILLRAKSLLDEKSDLERQVDRLSQKLAGSASSDLASNAAEVVGVKVVAAKISVETRDQMMAYADKLREQLSGEAVALLAGELDGKATLICVVTDDAFKKRGLKAGDLVKASAEYVDGRGGGRPTLAQAGGTKVEGLQDAVDNFEGIVRDALSS